MTALYIVIAILFFGILVIIHELGHFATAKAFRVKVDEFSVGFGPAIFQREKGETLYSIRTIPFGGYCAMMGENEASDDPRAFINQKAWKKLIVLIAGSFMNYLLGFILVVILVCAWNENPPFFAVIQRSWEICIGFVRLVIESLQMLLNGQAGVNDLSGPVGIVDYMVETAESAESAAYALSDLTYFGAFIAVNLAVMNMLPIPALDGGRVFFLIITSAIEAITKKKLDPKFEGYIHAAGMVLLLALMAYVLFHDVVRIVTGG